VLLRNPELIFKLKYVQKDPSEYIK